MRRKSSYRVTIPALIRNLSASLLLLASCTKLPFVDLPVDPQAPSNDPIILVVGGRETKGNAPIVNLATLAVVDFGVSAYYSGPGKVFDATSVKYFDNHRFGYVTDDLAAETTFSNPWQGVNAHGTAGAVIADPVYWPFDGTLSFFCYAPCQDGSADIVLEDPVTEAGIVSRLPDYLAGSPLIRVTPATSVADQVDFLAAPPILDRSRTDASGSSSLDLSQHRMTQVEFWFNATGSGEGNAVRVTSISLKDVIGSKYLYFKQNGCVWSDTVSPVAFGTELPRASYRISVEDQELDEVDVPERNAANDNHVASQTGKGVLYLLPQTLPDDAELMVSCSLVDQQGEVVGSKTLSYRLSQNSLSAWPEGKVVCYKLTLDMSTE